MFVCAKIWFADTTITQYVFKGVCILKVSVYVNVEDVFYIGSQMFKCLKHFIKDNAKCKKRCINDNNI